MSGAAAATEILARLVAFDTVSARSNRNLIEWIADYLAGQGIACTRVPDAGGDKEGLVATIGPARVGGFVLSGHTDVVPVKGQHWRTDPFTLIERDGRVYGRGATDMKGFIACALAMVPVWRSRPLAVPFHLALSYDEEVGCLGAPPLIEALLATVPRPAGVIVGEPSEMRVGDRHRGIHVFETTVRGRGGHASAPEKGASAIVAAARCIDGLERIAQDQATGGEQEPTTINVGVINGGAAVNMIAEHCRILWECRPAMGAATVVARAFEDIVARDILPPLRVVAPEATITTVETVAVPAFAAETDPAMVHLALRLTGQNTCVSVPFASEAGLFQLAGVAAVVCGPGSPAQAHQPDEFVAVAQLDACLAFLRRLTDWAERPGPNR